MAQLWEKLSRIYGHRWTSGFGEADDGTWLTGLRDLLPEELAAGLRACIRREDDWPPTLPEFRRLCLGYEDKTLAVERAIYGPMDDLSGVMREMVGSWDMRHSSEKDLRTRLVNVYHHAVEQLTRERMALSLDERKRLSHEG